MYFTRPNNLKLVDGQERQESTGEEGEEVFPLADTHSEAVRMVLAVCVSICGISCAVLGGP